MPPLTTVTQTAVNGNLTLLLSVVAEKILRCSSSRKVCSHSYCCGIMSYGCRYAGGELPVS